MKLPLQLKRYDVCCSLFVQLCAHELKYKFDSEQQDYMFLFEKVQGVQATADLLQGLTPAQVKKNVLAPLEIEWAMAFKHEQVRFACAHSRISVQEFV